MPKYKLIVPHKEILERMKDVPEHVNTAKFWINALKRYGLNRKGSTLIAEPFMRKGVETGCKAAIGDSEQIFPNWLLKRVD